MLVQNRPIESRAPRLWSVSVTLAALIMVAAVAALLAAPKAAAQGQSGTSEQSSAAKGDSKSSPADQAPPQPAKQARTRQPSPSSATVSPIQSENTERIKKALTSPTQLDFVKTPLHDVVDYLKDYHGIEIRLDSKAFGPGEVALDTPITTSLKGVSLRSALRLLLKDIDRAYTIRAGVLLITTPENAMEARVYPVRDLVLPPNPTKETQADFDSLIDVIKTTVQPTAWGDTGGAGSITPFENNLSIVVTQAEEVHEEIEQLLEKLRTVSREQKGEAWPTFKPRPKGKSDAEGAKGADALQR